MRVFGRKKLKSRWQGIGRRVEGRGGRKDPNDHEERE